MCSPGLGRRAALSIPGTPGSGQALADPILPLECQKRAAPGAHISSGASETRPCRGKVVPATDKNCSHIKGRQRGSELPPSPRRSSRRVLPRCRRTQGAKALAGTGSRHTGKPGLMAGHGASSQAGCCTSPELLQGAGRKKTGFFCCLVFFFAPCSLRHRRFPGSPSLALLAEQRERVTAQMLPRCKPQGSAGAWEGGGKTRNHAHLAFIFKSPSARAPGAAAQAGLSSPGFGLCGLGGAMAGCRMPRLAHHPPPCAPQKLLGTPGFPPFACLFLEPLEGALSSRAALRFVLA